MNRYLKGNYPLRRKAHPSSEEARKNNKAETSEQEFERRALEKLGGSIAFVVKSNFVWNGDQGEEAASADTRPNP